MESCTGSCSAHSPHLHPMPTPGSTPPAVNQGQPHHREIPSYWVKTCLLVHAFPWTSSITLGFGKGWVRQEDKGMARRYWPVPHENPTRCHLPVLLGSLLASPPAPRPPLPCTRSHPSLSQVSGMRSCPPCWWWSPLLTIMVPCSLFCSDQTVPLGEPQIMGNPRPTLRSLTAALKVGPAWMTHSSHSSEDRNLELNVKSLIKY